jgi:hypothetical protein
MGVYHFMGLGRSPGAVTAAISYLADRYERWDEVDAAFFATSGEFGQEGKRGDVQTLVLFSSREILEGQEEGFCSDYIDNTAGRTGGKLIYGGEPIPKMLKKVLPSDLKRAAGGREEVALYWCEIDRIDPLVTFERIARVMYAAKPPREVGKEIWVNLTGGTNIINLALQLSAALLGGPARLYYLLSDDPRCLRHTTTRRELGAESDRFWVDIPVFYLRLNDVARAILEVLEEVGTPLDDKDLLSRLKNHSEFWETFRTVELNELRRDYLLPMAGQQLVRRVNEHIITIGQQWLVLKHYYSVIHDLLGPDSKAEKNITDLSNHEVWIRKDTISL